MRNTCTKYLLSLSSWYCGGRGLPCCSGGGGSPPVEGQSLLLRVSLPEDGRARPSPEWVSFSSCRLTSLLPLSWSPPVIPPFSLLALSPSLSPFLSFSLSPPLFLALSLSPSLALPPFLPPSLSLSLSLSLCLPLSLFLCLSHF